MSFRIRMPRIISDNNTSTRRRSARNQPRKQSKKVVYEEIEVPTEEVNEVSNKDDNDDNIQMPDDYNPSDDSDVEYVQITRENRKTLKTKSKRSWKERVSSSSDEEMHIITDKRSRFNPNPYCDPDPDNPPPVHTLQVKEEPDSDHPAKCPFEGCGVSLNVEGTARIHLALHYFENNAFATANILKPKDAGKDGRAKDITGKAVKYHCEIPGCTKRQMGYKEICVHQATQHQSLKTLMMKDQKPEVHELCNLLYPPPEVPSPVKVKQERVEPTTVVEPAVSDNEDVDDPDELDDAYNPDDEEDLDSPDDPPSVQAQDPVVKSKASTRGPQLQDKTLPDKLNPSKTPKSKEEKSKVVPVRRRRPKTNGVDKLMNCIVCDERDGKNLSSRGSELKYHMSVCVYSMGGFLSILPAHQGTMVMEEIEEFGARFKYRCSFPMCDKSTGKAKPIGYKEFAIHSGVMHGILERWIEQNLDREGAREMLELLQDLREEEGLPLEEIPEIQYEELHVCFLCEGEDKEGKSLSFHAEQLYRTRYHYSACMYDTGLYVKLYNPGKQNLTADGKPRDILGREVKYACQERKCHQKRKMGYKEFCIHMSNDHGGLEKALLLHEDKRVRSLSKRLIVDKK